MKQLRTAVEGSNPALQSPVDEIPFLMIQRASERDGGSVLRLLGGVSLAGFVVGAANRLWFGPVEVAYPLIAGALAISLSLWLARRGKTEDASLLLFVAVWATILVAPWNFQGTHDTAVLAYPTILIFGRLLLRSRVFIVVTLVTIASLLVLGAGELGGVVVNRFSAQTNYAYLILVTFIIFGSAIISHYLVNNLAAAARRELTTRRDLENVNRALGEQTDAARASEARYKALVEMNPAAVIEWDMDFRVRAWSAAAERIFGYPREDAIGQHGRFIIPEGDWQDIRAAIEGMGSVRSGSQAIFANVRSDGQEIVCEWYNMPLADERGKVVAVASFVEDITEKRRSEEALRTSDAKFSMAFRTSPDYMSISSLKDGRFIEVNDAFERFTGRLREEVIGLSSFDIGLWVDDGERKVVVRSLLDSGRATDVECHLRVRSGEVRTVEVNATRLTVEGEDCLLAVVHDITERKLAEQKLRDSEEKFGELFRSSPLALALFSVDSPRYVDVNNAWLELFGHEREAVLGRTARELGLWTDMEAYRTVYSEAQSRTGSLGPFLVSLRRRDGDARECQLTGSAILRFGNGNHRIWAYADLTAMRQAQREIEALNASLESRVEERTRQLSEALDNLQRAQDELVRSEKLVALGSLVAGVAHELNTPIGNALTVASTLEDKTEEFLKEAASGALRRSALDSLTQASTQASRLIMRNLEQAATLIRNFKQVAVDQTSENRRRFALARTIEEVLTTLRHLVRDGRITVQTQLADGVTMDSYPGPLGQVLNNLFNNALAHAFEGRESGVIRIESVLAGEGEVVIRFADNGVGITESDRRRIFDPFFTTKLGRGGSGLGLNIVHNIVSGLLGGRITAESSPGQGTVFTLFLPLVAPAMASIAGRHPDAGR